MINSASGDILEAEVEAVVNTVNTVGVMGKGLALQVKRRYPENFRAYKRACDANAVRIGEMFVTETHEIAGPRFVINFPTKKHWRADSRLEYIEEGLVDLVAVIRERGITSIAVPPLGAGNGGLDWNKVRPLILDALAAVEGVRVELYEPVKQSFTVTPAENVRMSNSVALMVGLIMRYLERRHAAEPWEDTQGVSHLEIQKLMYFASLRVPQLKLEFHQGTYGPYSDVVRVMLQHTEGTFTSGFGDGSSRVLELVPVTVTERGRRDSEKFEPKNLAAETIDSAVTDVVDLVDGFEGAYPIELLASVDWARRKLGTNDETEVRRFVQEWTPRKGRMFTESHIRKALHRLNGHPVATART